MSVWSTSYGKALELRQGARAHEWESGACAHLATTTIALMRSFLSLHACEQVVERRNVDDSRGIDQQRHIFSEQHGLFVLGILSSCSEIFAFLFKHAVAFLPLVAPTAAQEFLLDEIINEWKRGKSGREGSHEFWDVVSDWQNQMITSMQEDMSLQRCATVQETLLLSVPIFLLYTDTCCRLVRTSTLEANVTYAKNLYIMRGMACPCAPCHPISTVSESSFTAPLLMHAVLSLAGALSEGLNLVDLCMKACITARTILVDHRKSNSSEPAPFRSQCTLLLAASSAWSAMIQASGITASVGSLLRDMSLWLPPSTLSSQIPAAAAAATEIANAFETQKNSAISVLMLLQSGLIQTFHSFDEVEMAADVSVVSHVEVEMQCLGATYLARRSFSEWASIRYPQMENSIFQPHSVKQTTEQCIFDVLFATQAGFLCALHADTVLAPELQMAGASSICTHDCVISLTEVYHLSAKDSSCCSVPDRLILFSDIVQYLLYAANPASGAVQSTYHHKFIVFALACCSR